MFTKDSLKKNILPHKRPTRLPTSGTGGQEVLWGLHKLRKIIAIVSLLGFFWSSIGIPGVWAADVPVNVKPPKPPPSTEPAKDFEFDLPTAIPVETKADKKNAKGEPTPQTNFFQDFIYGPLETFFSGLKSFDYGSFLNLVLRNALNAIVDKFYSRVIKNFEEEYLVQDYTKQVFIPYLDLGFAKFHNWMVDQTGGKMQAPLLNAFLRLENLAYKGIKETGLKLTHQIFKELEEAQKQAGEITYDDNLSAGDPNFFNKYIRMKSAHSLFWQGVGKTLQIGGESEARGAQDYGISDGRNRGDKVHNIPETLKSYWVTAGQNLKLDSTGTVLEVITKLKEWGYQDVTGSGGMVQGKGQYSFIQMQNIIPLTEPYLQLWSWHSDHPAEVRLKADIKLGGAQIAYNSIVPQSIKITDSSGLTVLDAPATVAFTSRALSNPLASGWTGLIKRPGQKVKQLVNDLINSRFRVAQEATDLPAVAGILYELANEYVSNVNFKVTRATSGPLKGCPTGFEAEYPSLDREIRKVDEPDKPSAFRCLIGAVQVIAKDTLPQFIDWITTTGKEIICWLFDVTDEVETGLDKDRAYEMVGNSATDPVDPHGYHLAYDTAPDGSQIPKEKPGSSRDVWSLFSWKWTAEFIIFVKLIKPHIPEELLPNKWIKTLTGAIFGDLGEWVAELSGILDLLGDFVDALAARWFIRWLLGSFGFCGVNDDPYGEPYPNPMKEADFLELPVKLEKDARVEVELKDWNYKLDRLYDMGQLKQGAHILRINMKTKMVSGSASMFGKGTYWIRILANGEYIKGYKKELWKGHCERNPEIGDPTTADLDRTDQGVQKFGIEIPKQTLTLGEEIEIITRWANRGQQYADNVRVRLYHLAGVRGSFNNFYQSYHYYDDNSLFQHADLLYDKTVNMSSWDGQDPANPYNCPNGGCGEIERVRWSAQEPGAHAFILKFDTDTNNNCPGNDRVVQIVNVQASPLVVANWSFSDDTQDSTSDGDVSAGDGTGKVNPGEVIEMTLDVENITDNPVSGATIYLFIPLDSPSFSPDPIGGENIAFIKLPNIPAKTKLSLSADLNFLVKGDAYNNDFSYLEVGIWDSAQKPIYSKEVPCPVKTQCRDGVDNDSDGQIDYPADSGCENWEDNSEGGAVDLAPKRFGYAMTDGSAGPPVEHSKIDPTFEFTNKGIVDLPPGKKFTAELYTCYGSDCSCKNAIDFNQCVRDKYTKFNEQEITSGLLQNATYSLTYSGFSILQFSDVYFGIKLDTKNEVNESDETNNNGGFDETYKVQVGGPPACIMQGSGCNPNSGLPCCAGLSCIGNICIPPQPSQTIVIDSCIFYDDYCPYDLRDTVCHDNNDIPEKGEEIDIKITLKNNSTTETFDDTVVLTPDDSRIQVLRNNKHYTLQPNGGTDTEKYRFLVPQDFPGADNLIFRLADSKGTGKLNTTFRYQLNVNSPACELSAAPAPSPTPSPTTPLTFDHCSIYKDDCPSANESVCDETEQGKNNPKANPGEKIYLDIFLNNTTSDKIKTYAILSAPGNTDLIWNDEKDSETFAAGVNANDYLTFKFTIPTSYSNNDTITFNLEGRNQSYSEGEINLNHSFTFALNSSNPCTRAYSVFPKEERKNLARLPLQKKNNLGMMHNIAGASAIQPLTLKQRITRVWNYVKDSLFH